MVSVWKTIELAVQLQSLEEVKPSHPYSSQVWPIYSFVSLNQTTQAKKTGISSNKQSNRRNCLGTLNLHDLVLGEIRKFLIHPFTAYW